MRGWRGEGGDQCLSPWYVSPGDDEGWGEGGGGGGGTGVKVRGTSHLGMTGGGGSLVKGRGGGGRPHCLPLWRRTADHKAAEAVTGNANSYATRQICFLLFHSHIGAVRSLPLRPNTWAPRIKPTLRKKAYSPHPQASLASQSAPGLSALVMAVRNTVARLASFSAIYR